MRRRLSVTVAGFGSLAWAIAVLCASGVVQAAGLPSIRWQSAPAVLSHAGVALQGAELAKVASDDDAVVQPEYRIGIHFRQDGDIVETQRRTAQFLKAGGFDAYGNIELGFDASATTATIRRAEVLRPDGSVMPVDRKTVQTVNFTAGGVFSDDVTVVVPWTGLRVGAVGVLEAELVTRGSSLVMPWARLVYPVGSVPRGQFSLVVTWDEGVAEPDVVPDEGAPKCLRTGPRKIECSAGALAAIASDPNVNYVDEVPAILVTQRHDWPALAARMRGIADAAAVVDDAVRAKAAELTRDVAEPLAKVRSLHSFVSRDVRYLGLEHGEKGFVPEPAPLTLRRRFGDCKDKAVLFIALARAAGLDAVAVLSSTTRKNMDRIVAPSMAWFDHMVACVDVKSGETLCIDLTDDATATGDIAPQMNGAVALRLAPGVSVAAALPVAQFGWRLTEVTNNTIDEAGNVVEQQERRYAGELAGFIRRQLRDLGAKERAERAASDYQQWIGDKVRPAFTFSGLADQQATPTLTSTTSFPALVTGGESETFSDRLVWLEELAGWASTTNDDFPYRFSGISYDGTQVYELHPSFKPDWLGPRLSFESRFGTVKRSYQRAGQRITVTTAVHYPARTVPVADIPAFTKAIRNLETQSRIHFGIAGGR